MKTFITSSSLAILSAVVFAWFLVQTGEELPRRSPESYPPLGGAPVEPAPEAPESVVKMAEEVMIREEAPSEVADTAESAEPGEKEQVEWVEEEPAGNPEESEPVYSGEMGPPAPVLPFVLNINAAEEGVLLQGSIPTREMRDAILGSIDTVFEEEEIDSRLKFSPDTRSGLWIPYLPDFLERYFRYTAGMQEVTVVDGGLILSGAVASDQVKETILQWAKPLQSGGLKIRDQVDVDNSLEGSGYEIPEELATRSLARFCPFSNDRIDEGPVTAGDESIASVEESDPAEFDSGATVRESGEQEEGVEELVFLAPFEEQYEVHSVPDLRELEPTSASESSRSTSSSVETAIGSSEPDKESMVPLVDDGKPLIFEFESPAGEIVSADRPKIDFAVKRAQRSRSIVYITGYSDYRGDFEANQELARARANQIKDLIFSNEVAEDVTAEVKTRGDVLSKKRTGKETDDQLRRSRRVVVEVYHLK